MALAVCPRYYWNVAAPRQTQWEYPGEEDNSDDSDDSYSDDSDSDASYTTDDEDGENGTEYVAESAPCLRKRPGGWGAEVRKNNLPSFFLFLPGFAGFVFVRVVSSAQVR